ncbi:MAG: radical SAM protein [Dehalococcoidia bacterium]|jgi:putative pyruvate formate lyase activating enzyme|nr:MAG: radical SAM protein [Dehalococcoidia bacterium]
MTAGYLELYRSGELAQRLERLKARLAACDLCPRKCGTNRLAGEKGWCRAGYLPSVASVCAHFGEEPALSGSGGSGTVFFAGCNMACIYCQNYQISQERAVLKSGETSFSALAEKLLWLQEQGCHNINFVSPSHFVPQMVRVVLEAASLGLTLPLVYNSSGYDSVATLKELDGIIDIYLPDLRYADEVWGRKLSQAPEYPANARAAIREMFRQVGNLKVDDEGVAERGLIVRHLVLPGGLAGSRSSLKWLAREVSSGVTVSLMSQYHPANQARSHPLLSRRISLEEYRETTGLLEEFGIINGWVQEMASAESYLPDFAREGSPFVPD